MNPPGVLPRSVMDVQLERVLLVAAARINVTECPPDTNRGLAVESYQKATGNGPGAPWCASFVVSCFDCAGVPFPFTRSGLVQAIVNDARVKNRVEASPRVGDLFVLWYSSLGRYGHIGFVTGVRDDGTLETIEGNTSGGGSREGWGVMPKVRRPDAKTRYLRWVGAM